MKQTLENFRILMQGIRDIDFSTTDVKFSY